MEKGFDPIGHELLESHGERGTVVVHLPLRPSDHKRLAARHTVDELDRQATVWTLLAAAACVASGGGGEVAERTLRILGDVDWMRRRIEAELVRLSAEMPAAQSG